MQPVALYIAYLKIDFKGGPWIELAIAFWNSDTFFWSRSLTEISNRNSNG